MNVVKRWYADIAALRAKHHLVVLMLDNACEYKSEEIMQFLDSREFEVISVHQKNNGRIVRQKQQSTPL